MPQDTGNAVLLFCTDANCANAFLSRVMELYRLSLYSYNNVAKRYGVYLKPFHIVVKKTSGGAKTYYYYGRYWYRIEYNNGRLKWLYIGKEKPLPQLPEPPVNPFTAVRVLDKKENVSCIYVDNIHDLKRVLPYIEEAVSKTECLKPSSLNTAAWYYG